MAIYHCSIKIISRGKGKSAVAAAAYRAGDTITNEYDGITHDYSRKGGVVRTEVLLPEQAPKEYADRSTLWNAVEQIEKNKNSQLAREIELALPVELSQEQNISLVREYVQRHFVEAGMCADVAVHDKNDGNPHVHIMLTMRPFEQDGEWGAKSRKEYLLDKHGERIRLKSGEFKTRKVDMMGWNEQTKAEEWRAAWAVAMNAALESQGLEERVDHRSFLRQGKEEIPAVHLGVSAAQMERRGINTEQGNMNRIIEGINQHLRQLWEQIKSLKDRL
ncbi:MAG: MobQ family relaxase, partial [Bacillota bacterium]